MKRYFQAVEKGADGSGKKAKEDNNAEEEEATKKEPLKFMTWNANSLFLRVKNNWADFTNLVTTFDPHVIAIQEVRMPAAGGSKGSPKNQADIKDDTNPSREEKKVGSTSYPPLPL